MVDFRYHVISLIAVFLALGIGVLLGTTLVERGLIAEQKNEIESLKETFQEIRENNRELNESISFYSDFSNQVMPYVVSDKLSGRTYAKASSCAIGDYMRNQIDSTLSEAGASTTMDITFSSTETFNDPKVVESLSVLFVMEPDPNALRERVISEVVTMLASGTNPEVLSRLEEIGVIQVSGDLVGPVNGVILMANMKEEDVKEGGKLFEIDLPLISQLTAAGMPTVGVEGSNVEYSVIPQYAGAGISTIDHVDTVPGMTALVFVFEGRWGNYGQEEPAERIIPEMVRP